MKAKPKSVPGKSAVYTAQLPTGVKAVKTFSLETSDIPGKEYFLKLSLAFEYSGIGVFDLSRYGLFLGSAILLGRYGNTLLLHAVARTRSRELFTLTVIGTCAAAVASWRHGADTTSTTASICPSASSWSDSSGLRASTLT